MTTAPVQLLVPADKQHHAPTFALSVSWPPLRAPDHYSLGSQESEAAYLSVLGFKKLDNAAIIISGVELAQKIRNGQFNTTELTNRVGRRDVLQESLLRL